MESLVSFTFCSKWNPLMDDPKGSCVCGREREKVPPCTPLPFSIPMTCLTLLKVKFIHMYSGYLPNLFFMSHREYGSGWKRQKGQDDLGWCGWEICSESVIRSENDKHDIEGTVGRRRCMQLGQNKVCTQGVTIPKPFKTSWPVCSEV